MEQAIEPRSTCTGSCEKDERAKLEHGSGRPSSQREEKPSASQGSTATSQLPAPIKLRSVKRRASGAQKVTEHALPQLVSRATPARLKGREALQLEQPGALMGAPWGALQEADQFTADQELISSGGAADRVRPPRQLRSVKHRRCLWH